MFAQTIWQMMEGPMYNFGIWSEGPALKDHLAQCGVADRPFWITETGWDSNRLGEAKQADFYQKFLAGIEARTWVQNVFFYEIQDDPTRPDGVRQGLIDEGYRKKASFNVLRSALVG